MGDKEKEVLNELRKSGFKYKNVDELFMQTQLKSEEVEIILKKLPGLYMEDVAVADTLVRSLLAASKPFDPSILIDLFENSDLNYALKGGIANTLTYAKTTDISDWIKDQLLNKEYFAGKNSLIGGLYSKGKFNDVREFMEFLKTIFDKYHNNMVLKIFKKFGNQDDMMFLQQKIGTADEKLARGIKKTINKK